MLRGPILRDAVDSLRWASHDVRLTADGATVTLASGAVGANALTVRIPEVSNPKVTS